MTLQSDLEKLSEAWRDFGYAVAKETRLIRLIRRLGMEPKPWVLEREKREEAP